MKSLKLGLLVSFIGFACVAHADVIRKEKVLSDFSPKLTVELTPATVRCIRGGYGAESLKITIPELKSYTIFRQTTSGETEPCINAGVCTPGSGLNTGSILDPGKPNEAVVVNIKLVEVMDIDQERKICTRGLVETVAAKVRGINFSHSDSGSLGETSVEACEALAK
jgi:hypothetical protein